MDYNLTFDSLDALLLEADKPSPLPEYERASVHNTDKAFCPVTINEAMVLARAGWADGAAKMAHCMEACAVKGVSYAYCADVTGEFFDMADVIAGVPECWREEVALPGRGVVDIFVATTIAENVCDIFRRGAAICNLVDTLETDGFRVRVVAVVAARNGTRGSFQALIDMKRHSDALDIDKMAFVFAHLGFCRRIVFAMQEAQSMKCIKDCGARLSDGFGTPNRIRPRGIDEKALFIPSNVQFTTDEEAQAWIKNTVADAMK